MLTMPEENPSFTIPKQEQRKQLAVDALNRLSKTLGIESDVLRLSEEEVLVYNDINRKVKHQGIMLHFVDNPKLLEAVSKKVGQVSLTDNGDNYYDRINSVCLIAENDWTKWYLPPEKEGCPWTEVPETHLIRAIALHLEAKKIEAADSQKDTSPKKKIKKEPKCSFQQFLFAAIIASKQLSALQGTVFDEDFRLANSIDRKIRGFFSIYRIDVDRDQMPTEVEIVDGDGISVHLHVGEVKNFQSRIMPSFLWSQIRGLNIGVGEQVPQELTYSSKNGFTIKGFEPNIKQYIKKHAKPGQEDVARMEAIDVLLSISSMSTIPDFWDKAKDKVRAISSLERFVNDNNLLPPTSLPDWVFQMSKERDRIEIKELQRGNSSS